MRWCLLLLGVTVAAQVPEPKIARKPPDQPLPFSHKTHAGTAALACNQCHPMPDPGDFATLPATQVCMSCHIAIKKDSPHIAKLAEYHAAGKKISWAPVYRVPDYVFFNHKRHIAVDGVTCATCHGPVAEREVLRREKDISMQGCMECHRVKNARNNCNYCHDPR